MINLEFYKDEIVEIKKREENRILECLLREMQTKNYDCEVCTQCLKESLDWLLEEHKEPPKKTYKEDFFEKFPEAEIGDICRYSVYKTDRCEDRFIGDCEACWNESMEMKDEK